jgi:hypothetical protein
MLLRGELNFTLIIAGGSFRHQEQEGESTRIAEPSQ